MGDVRFSLDGTRYSYAANDKAGGKNRWSRVIDGVMGPIFDGMLVDFAFSPDGKHSAYFAVRGGATFLVTDGGKEQQIEGFLDNTLVFSPDSKRMAYGVAKADGKNCIVVDGRAGQAYDSVGLPRREGSAAGYYSGGPAGVAFSPDGQRLAYMVREGTK